MIALNFLIALCANQIPTEDPALTTIRSYIQATLDFKPEVLETILHTDYIEISPLGDVDNRKKTISYYQPELKLNTPVPDSFSISEEIIRHPEPKTSVVIYQITYKIVKGDQSVNFAVRATTVVKQNAQGWQIYSNHFTAIKKKSTIGSS